MLVWPTAPDEKEKKGFPLISEDDLFIFLEDRKGKLDGVVITGGEPTLHKDLPEFIAKIKEMGYLVKLDSNGTNPEMLQDLINKKLIDYIAMDIKASWNKYEEAVGVKVGLEKLKKSVKMIMSSGLPYEFRTTLVPGLHDSQDIKAMGEMIKGADHWYLQKFKPDVELVDHAFENKVTFKDSELKEFEEIGSQFVKDCQARI